MSETPYTNEDDVTAAVRANYAAQLRALLAGDADALGELLTDSFSQTHLTGQRQSRGDWLAAVRSGEMSYHAVDVVEESVDLSSGMPDALRAHPHGRHHLGGSQHLAAQRADALRTRRHHLVGLERTGLHVAMNGGPAPPSR